MSKNTEVAATQNSALLDVTNTALPDWLQPKGNRGSEEVGASDITLPRIGIIQAISPQLKKNDPAYIQGAEQGQLYNTLTSELYPEGGIIFVPVLFRKEWVAFKDREKGGGFRGAWPFVEEVQARTAIEQMEDAADIDLLESHSHIGYVVKPDGSLEQAIIACTKSAIKFSRKINSLVTMAGVDRFAKAYSIGTVEATSPKGEYWTFDVKPMGFVNQNVYREAETMYEMLKDRKIGTNYAEDDAEHVTGGKSYNADEEKEF